MIRSGAGTRTAAWTRWIRAKLEVGRLLGQYKQPSLPQEALLELHKLVNFHAMQAGMESLPEIPIITARTWHLLVTVF